jgi:hypothetical protein
VREARRDKSKQVACVKRQAFRVNGRRVEVRFAEVEGRLICIGLEVGPPVYAESFIDAVDEDLDELKSAEIRYPLRELVDRALESPVLVFPGVPDEELYITLRHMSTLVERTVTEKKGPGRKPVYGSDHFEEVARIYNEHWQKGGRAPTKAVADRFRVSKSAAAKWVARAREMGLLAPYGEKR